MRIASMVAEVSRRNRRSEKQASRGQDQLDISEGNVSPRAVHLRNDWFGAFDPSRATIRVKHRA